MQERCRRAIFQSWKCLQPPPRSFPLCHIWMQESCVEAVQETRGDQVQVPQWQGRSQHQSDLYHSKFKHKLWAVICGQKNWRNVPSSPYPEAKFLVDAIGFRNKSLRSKYWLSNQFGLQNTEPFSHTKKYDGKDSWMMYFCWKAYQCDCLGMPSFQKSAVFLNIVQKAFDPPPLLFEHLSYFAGGIF